MFGWLAQVWDDFTRITVLFPVEAAVVLGFVLLFQNRRFARWGLGPLRRPLVRLARRPLASFVAVAAFTIVGHFLAEPAYRIPPPGIHDEFSYLLAADTFASGRLTNPTHPMHYFFETFHVLSEPTYMSMYPPGQGLFLGLGQSVFGHAIAGVWLSAALLAGAVTWMARAWTPPLWALFAGALCAVRVGWFSYWGNSYWGGCVGALGGVLMLGAMGRLERRITVPNALLFVAGAFLLSITRMYEGLVFALTLSAFLAWRLRRPLSLGNWRPAAGAALLAALAGGGWLGYYNYRITGDPLRLPYVENRARNEVYGSFVWSKPTPDKAYPHEMIRRFYYESEKYRELVPYWEIQAEKLKRIWFFFLGPALTVPLIVALSRWRSRRTVFCVATIITFVASHLLVPWHLQAHYASPLLGSFYLLLLEGFRRLRVWRRRQSKFPGASVLRAVMAALVVMVLVRAVAPAANIFTFGVHTQPWYSYGLLANFYRQGIQASLQRMGGKHLVLVSYDYNHRPDLEWVFNGADIDAAPVIWARHVRDRAARRQLFQYFRDRQVWIVYPDYQPGQLVPFEETLP